MQKTLLAFLISGCATLCGEAARADVRLTASHPIDIRSGVPTGPYQNLGIGDLFDLSLHVEAVGSPGPFNALSYRILPTTSSISIGSVPLPVDAGSEVLVGASATGVFVDCRVNIVGGGRVTLVLIDTLAPFPFSTQVLPQLEGTLFTTDFSSRTFGFSVPAQGTAGSFNFTALGFQEVEITNFTPTTFTFCDGRSNSTGVAAELEAVGQTSVSANDLRLHMSNMPMNSFGFFLVSRTPGLVPGAGGGPGTLCLDGAIGRYVAPGQIQTSGTQGEISLQLDLNQVPTPNGPVAVLAGERWHFQGWYRDIIAGNATSNFSSGVWVEFQ